MPAAAVQSRPNATRAAVVLVGPWSGNEEHQSPGIDSGIEIATGHAAQPHAEPTAPSIKAPSAPAHPGAASSSPSTAWRWWSDLFLGLALRTGEVLQVLALPALLLWRHRRAAALLTVRATAPAVVAFVLQGQLAAGNAASMPPWSSPLAAGTFALLYMTSAIGLVIALAMGRRASAGTRRWLDDVARYGAANRPPR